MINQMHRGSLLRLITQFCPAASGGKGNRLDKATALVVFKAWYEAADQKQQAAADCAMAAALQRQQSKPRGFATLPIERRKEIGSQGGTTAHKMGKAHRFTSEEARAAGRLGGRSTHEKFAKLKEEHNARYETP